MHPIRHHIALITEPPARQRLLEHVVVNQDAMDDYIQRFVQRTEPPSGQAWLVKRLRSHISNDASLLQAIPHEEAELLSGMPDYAQRQVSQGGPVYRFISTSTPVGQFSNLVDHLVDWFNGLQETVASPQDTAIAVQDRQRAERVLAGLSKISFVDATTVADAWFRDMGSRVQREKSGVEVIHRWPDGFYAVRYTDLDTYKSDGRILQQCLQTGTYWSEIQRATMAIFVLRRPNDEPVATIGCYQNGDKLGLSQLKGKNNKPVQPTYSKYLAEFMTKFAIVPAVSGQSDLENAGLSYNAKTKAYGDFMQIAELIINQPGLKVWATDKKFLASVQGQRLTGILQGKHIASLDGHDNDDRDDKELPHGSLLQLLNGLALPPTAGFAEFLRTTLDSDIVFNAGKYGTVAEVADKIPAPAGFLIYSVPQPNDHYNQTTQRYVVYRNSAASTADFLIGTMVVTTTASLAQLTGISGGLQPGRMANISDLEALLNAIPEQPEPSNEVANRILPLVFTGKHYGQLTKVGKPVVQAAGATIWQVAAKGSPLVVSNEKQDEFIWLIPPHGHQRELSWTPANMDANLAKLAPVVRAYVVTNGVKQMRIDGDTYFGMLNVPKGVIADYKSLLDYIETLPAKARPFHTGPLFTCARAQFGASSVKSQPLSSAQQHRLYELFRPSAEQPVDIILLETYRVFDLQIPRFAILLPLANPTLWDDQVLTDSKVKTAIKADILRAMVAVGEHLKAQGNKPAFSNFGDQGRDAAPRRQVDKPKVIMDVSTVSVRARIHTLLNKMDAMNQKTIDELSERRRHLDKYAGTNMSDRFAAQNVFRKFFG